MKAKQNIRSVQLNEELEVMIKYYAEYTDQKIGAAMRDLMLRSLVPQNPKLKELTEELFDDIMNERFPSPYKKCYELLYYLSIRECSQRNFGNYHILNFIEDGMIDKLPENVILDGAIQIASLLAEIGNLVDKINISKLNEAGSIFQIEAIDEQIDKLIAMANKDVLITDNKKKDIKLYYEVLDFIKRNWNWLCYDYVTYRLLSIIVIDCTDFYQCDTENVFKFREMLMKIDVFFQKKDFKCFEQSDEERVKEMIFGMNYLKVD